MLSCPVNESSRRECVSASEAATRGTECMIEIVGQNLNPESIDRPHGESASNRHDNGGMLLYSSPRMVATGLQLEIRDMLRVLHRMIAWIGCLQAANLLAQISPATLPDLRLTRGGQVEAIAIQADGKVIVGGVFEAINGVARRNLGRLNPNGSVDLTW